MGWSCLLLVSARTHYIAMGERLEGKKESDWGRGEGTNLRSTPFIDCLLNVQHLTYIFFLILTPGR